MNRSFFTASILLASLSLVHCQSRKHPANSDPESTSQSKLGLDVNDVAFLFPLPTSPVQIKEMLPINFKNAKGVSPMTPELFKDILSRHDGEIEVEGKKVKLKSGSAFNPDRAVLSSPSRGDLAFGPYNLIADWKIVAMRFDPCAPSPLNNLRGHAPLVLNNSMDLSKCAPQLRLTAQPILDETREHRAADNGPVRVGDFAIHMLFSLDSTQAKQLYSELVAFKMSCGDLTSSMPAMVQPCVTRDSKRLGYNKGSFLQVKAMIERYAVNYYGTAMFASRNGDDPWTFMNGLIVDGKFKHLQIDAVKKDDPSKLKRNAQGALLEPFSNGYFQQIAFMAVGGVQHFGADAITPRPIESKVNIALFSGPGPDNLPKLAAKIENPLHTDFFSTDCVSCHSTSDTIMHEMPYDTPKLNMSTAVYLDNDLFFNSVPKVEPSTRNLFRDRLSFAETMKIDGPYTPFASIGYATEGPRGSLTNFIHFGYFNSKPSISQRLANEAAVAAKLANRMYGGGNEPPVLCAQSEIYSCMTETKVLYANYSEMINFPLSHCMHKICPARENQVGEVFGAGRERLYRLKEDITVSELYGRNRFKIKAGWEVRAAFNPADEGQTRLLTYEPVAPVVDRDGTKYFVESRKVDQVRPGKKFESYFELVKP